MTYWKLPNRPRTARPPIAFRWYLAGIAISFVFAGSIAWLIRAAWIACDDVGPGNGLALLFLIGPGTLALALVSFAISLHFRRQVPTAIRFGIGLVFAMMLCWSIVIDTLPAYGEGYKSEWADAPACSPSGMPVWWPSWLPH